ncbi:hypothetical protein FJT64_018519 [Amphibalanus amphitrite]|uniref:Uncharacterized protein n=1 Tax=Amphibalanus amphitrite TaxID=1232801 RepID=A0A6A4X7Y1_AMPAM|nr:hypothetical protein FJT64_018519 [Amphibalanus amphitrite]
MPPAYMFPQLAPESSARAADPADGATDRNDNPVDEVDRAPAADRRLRLGQEQLTVLQQQQQQVKEQQVKEQQQKEQEAMDLDANLNPAENGSHMESQPLSLLSLQWSLNLTSLLSFQWSLTSLTLPYMESSPHLPPSPFQ